MKEGGNKENMLEGRTDWERREGREREKELCKRYKNVHLVFDDHRSCFQDELCFNFKQI